jgi:hypothetical protein
MTFHPRGPKPFSGENMRSENLLAPGALVMFTNAETSKMASFMPSKSLRTNTQQKRRHSNKEKFKFCSVLTRIRGHTAHM